MDPKVRLRRGLIELYLYWAEIEPMAARVLRDHRVAPERVGGGFIDYMCRCRNALTEGRKETGAPNRRVRASVGHATRFETWHSLVREGGLSAREAVDVMVGAVDAAASRPPSQ